MKALMIAGTASASGKTSLSMGLMRLLQRHGQLVQPFKAGPDFIDPMFHEWVCGRPSYNLDSFMLKPDVLQTLFVRHATGDGINIVEGMMGFYDGQGPAGIGSPAELAGLLGLPVLLVVDCRAMHQSVVAIVAGFLALDSHRSIRGVILNQVSVGHHFQFLKSLIEEKTGITVLGHLPPLPDLAIESRHLGLLQAAEVAGLDAKVDKLATTLEQTLDLARLLSLADNLSPPCASIVLSTFHQDLKGLRLGLAWDNAFSFYYADNLELLVACGAEITRFSPLADASLPSGLDALYIGGGYPEEIGRAHV